MKSLVFYVIGPLLLLSIGISVFCFAQLSKIKTIDIIKVYDQFQMKIDLENQMLKEQEAKSRILDSAKVELDLMLDSYKKGDKTFSMDEFQKRKEIYMRNYNQYEDEAQEKEDKYKVIIMKRLKQYLSDYSNKKGINVLLGNDGGIVLLFSNPDMDLTSDVLEYANQKYKATN
jgi:outer membrane protein